MVFVFEGDGPNSIPAPQVAAYQQAAAIPQASRTTEEQQVVDAVDAKFANVIGSWNAIQRDVSPEVLAFATSLQGDMTRVIRQYAGPGRERAYTEMFSTVTARMVEMERVILELRERVVSLGG